MKTDKLSADIKEFLGRQATVIFLDTSRKFVGLLETEDISKEEFYSKAHIAILELYLAGHKLEQIELKYSPDDRDFDRDAIFEHKNVGQISELGAEAFYWEVFDPRYSEKDGQPDTGWVVTDREASQGWLIDDFEDIYRDLKIELLKIDSIGTDEAVEDALWNFKWSFVNHWGQHAVNAIRYFHYLTYDGKPTI
ncbi:MAG: DUF5063 domain-containing protein [Pedobacter sp.]|uniref:DUF5063 domain-containing protein n=1 Tax=Pedobacter sp. TaxID=1411316 RepID=UPI002807E1E3|nr:DUF5063 domain-containing protein [Pedobacter sp.]MDQ8005863.1 DUF5063 domain-containing protein [Pedobacter sp.]